MRVEVESCEPYAISRPLDGTTVLSELPCQIETVGWPDMFGRLTNKRARVLAFGQTPRVGFVQTHKANTSKASTPRAGCHQAETS
jgi:hypothetical protein